MTDSNEEIGIVIVDHGSLREESNLMLLDVVALFERSSEYNIVEPAHMELAEPSVSAAFARCVERGATFVIVFPYFLLPGRHWDRDIPHLTAEAARAHPGVKYLVTAPLGLHELMTQIIRDRIAHCLAFTSDSADPCNICMESDKCRIRVESGEVREP